MLLPAAVEVAAGGPGVNQVRQAQQGCSRGGSSQAGAVTPAREELRRSSRLGPGLALAMEILFMVVADFLVTALFMTDFHFKCLAVERGGEMSLSPSELNKCHRDKSSA